MAVSQIKWKFSVLVGLSSLGSSEELADIASPAGDSVIEEAITISELSILLVAVRAAAAAAVLKPDAAEAIAVQVLDGADAVIPVARNVEAGARRALKSAAGLIPAGVLAGVDASRALAGNQDLGLDGLLGLNGGGRGREGTKGEERDEGLDGDHFGDERIAVEL